MEETACGAIIYKLTAAPTGIAGALDVELILDFAFLAGQVA